MTNEQQIKALAELDGWKFIRVDKGPYNNAGFRVFLNDTEKGGFSDFQGFECVHNMFNIPRYLSSYDAIIPLLRKQPESVLHKVADAMDIMTTPTQLAEALLRATNNWKD